MSRLDEIETRLVHNPAMMPTVRVGRDDLAALVAVVTTIQAARSDLDHHHSHMVPGRWDKDGSRCDVCARVEAMDDALAALGTDGGAS